MGAPWWPLRHSAHPPILHAHSEHDDGVDLLLPHQPPEVLQGLLQRPLGGDEFLRVAVPLWG